VGAHWFDRLARVQAASSRAGVGESAGLTRRDALTRAGAGTLGFGALGFLGAVPATASATPGPARPTSRALAGLPAACGECNKEANKFRNKLAHKIDNNLYRAAPTPAVAAAAFVWAIASITNEAARSSELRECSTGACNPQSYLPAPSANPATEAETGAVLCPGDTHDCGTIPGSTSHYCCFGSDVCCHGTCCIAEVGCACAP
jgi:hypothetical protein